MTGPAAAMVELLGTVALAVVIFVVGYALIAGGASVVSKTVDAIIEWFIGYQRRHMSIEEQVLISHLNIERLEREMGMDDPDE